MLSSLKQLDLSQLSIMAILNLNSQSLSPKGKNLTISDALRYAEKVAQSGAHILDIGAEPTNPSYSEQISVAQELDLLLPVLEQLSHYPLLISVDTSRAEVIKEVLKHQVTMINDTRAVQCPGALETLVDSDAYICLMHMSEPGNGIPHSILPKDNYIHFIIDFLLKRAVACQENGIEINRLILDPGFGHGKFGKDLQQNLSMLKNLQQFTELAFPIMVSLSRKTFIGELLNLAIEDRMPASIAAAVIAMLKGVKIIRTHDVEETVQALKLVSAIQ